MILLRELHPRSLPAASEWPDLGITAGFWLLNDADVDADWVKGREVPGTYNNAYGGGSVNPANTKYTRPELRRDVTMRYVRIGSARKTQSAAYTAFFSPACDKPPAKEQ